jgi:hypothetical protein
MRTATTGETLAERAVIRMQDAASPMPPAPSAPAAATDISALQDWINAGMPQGSCSLVEDPLNDPSTACANGRWSGGESERMEPGGACNQCHRQEGEGPRYSIAGTVYSSGHQQNRCYGVSTGVQVVITGADGRQFPLNPNSSGNFTLSSSQLMTPYTAKVVDTTTGAERVMVTPQTEGDCNTCHTQTGSGTPPAPGRITVPIQ